MTSSGLLFGDGGDGTAAAAGGLAPRRIYFLAVAVWTHASASKRL